MVKTITRDELQSKVDRGEHFVLAEILDPSYYAQGHLPGAVNMPLERVGELAQQLIPDKGADVVVYCYNPM